MLCRVLESTLVTLAFAIDLKGIPTEEYLSIVSEGVTEETATVRIDDGDDTTTLTAQRGRTLRDVLREHDHSPYTSLTSRLNCGGRGLCATCGVRILKGDLPPEHWHDRLADCFGYPRLSCQVTIDEDLVVALPEKMVWGSRKTTED